MKKNVISLSEIKEFLNEGDVALYAGKGCVSRIIASQTQTKYSHCGVLSWVNGDKNTPEGILEVVQFREWKGGISVNLEEEVRRQPGQIDIYRPIPVFSHWEFDLVTKQATLVKEEFDGKKVTRLMRKMTGQVYGWKRIWWMIKNKLLLLRFFSNEAMMDDDGDLIYPVCSTSLSWTFKTPGYDLIFNKNSNATEPGHIALSPRLNYFCTLTI